MEADLHHLSRIFVKECDEDPPAKKILLEVNIMCLNIKVLCFIEKIYSVCLFLWNNIFYDIFGYLN